VADEYRDHLEADRVVDLPGRSPGDERRRSSSELGRLAVDRGAPAARQDIQDLVVRLGQELVRGAVKAEKALLERVAAPFGAKERRLPWLDGPLHRRARVPG